MSELPKGWVNTTIGDILQSQLDGKLIHQGWSPQCHAEAADLNDWGVLKTTAIQDGFFLEEHNKKLPQDKEPRERIEVNSGDLLMTNAGPRARCGVTTLVKDVRPKLMLSGKMYRMRFNENYIYPAFIEACLRSEKVRAEIDSRKTGMSESGLNLTQARFLTVPFLLAPYNEQIRIANKLDSILAKVDKAQARLDKIPTILKRFRQSVLAAATSGELTKEWREDNDTSKVVIENLDTVNDAYDIWERTTKLDRPANWTYCKLSQTGRVQGGGTPRKSNSDYWDGDIPWVTPKDMKRDFINESQLMVTKIGVSESSAKMIDSSSILFVVRGMILAHSFPVALNLRSVTVNQDMKCITPAKFIESKYLLYVLKSQKDLFVELASSSTHGTKRLEAKMYNNVAIPVCPIEEQAEIVRIIEGLLERANKVEKQYLDAKARLDRLTQSILAKAFRGELVAQDPNDEAADKLLERILVERELEKPKKKPTKKRATKAKTVEKG